MSADAGQKLSAEAQRVADVLWYAWGNSQTRMAAAIGVSQSVISHVIVGRQQPGRKLLAAIAKSRLVNSLWLLTGEGEPEIVREPNVK